MNSVLYTEKAAFPSLASLIKEELTVSSDQSSPNLATLPVQGFATYEPCIQSSHYRTEAAFPLLHNTVISELSHYEIEMMMSSPNSETLIDIIYN